MNRHTRTLAALALAFAGPSVVDRAYAGPNAAIDALENTPVSMLSYGLEALNEGVNGYLGRGGRPSPSAMFKAPLSGPVADLATTLLDETSGTITINLIHIADLGDGTSDDACKQAFAAIHLLATADPTSGKLYPGMLESSFPAFFEADGTLSKSPVDMPTLDKAFRLRFNGMLNGQRFVCTASLFGTDYKLQMLK